MSPSSNVKQLFKLTVPDSNLELLHKKLKLVQSPDELEGIGWDYSTLLADIKSLVMYWKDKYDWCKVEARINELPMFMCDIDITSFGTLSIHYIHQKSKVENAILLLFVHGYIMSAYIKLGPHAVTHYGHKHIKVWHSNIPFTGGPPSFFKHLLVFLKMFLLLFRKAKLEGLKMTQHFDLMGSGYNHQQSTCPQILVYGLSDSPVLLLAWIYEKLVG
ncbi:Alpha/Beta hydrolase protein [Fomes fomentarius]|nr:Alpha/Beta hydrolase protein [Fomes fomentarius]